MATAERADPVEETTGQPGISTPSSSNRCSVPSGMGTAISQSSSISMSARLTTSEGAVGRTSSRRLAWVLRSKSRSWVPKAQTISAIGSSSMLPMAAGPEGGPALKLQP